MHRTWWVAPDRRVGRTSHTTRHLLRPTLHHVVQLYVESTRRQMSFSCGSCGERGFRKGLSSEFDIEIDRLEYRNAKASAPIAGVAWKPKLLLKLCSRVGSRGLVVHRCESSYVPLSDNAIEAFSSAAPNWRCHFFSTCRISALFVF